MGDVIPFPRIRSASEGLQAALRELDEAMEELRVACAERDRLLIERMSPAEVKLAWELGE